MGALLISVNKIRNSVNQKIRCEDIVVSNVPPHSVKTIVDADIRSYHFKGYFSEAMSSNPKIRAQVRSDGEALTVYLFNDSNAPWTGTVFVFAVK